MNSYSLSEPSICSAWVPFSFRQVSLRHHETLHHSTHSLYTCTRRLTHLIHWRSLSLAAVTHADRWTHKRRIHGRYLEKGRGCDVFDGCAESSFQKILSRLKSDLKLSFTSKSHSTARSCPASRLDLIYLFFQNFMRNWLALACFFFFC